MNPVWQKLNLGMVTKAMHNAAGVICEEERMTWINHCCASSDADIDPSYEGPFAQSIWKWFGRLVTSQKCLLNLGDKENKHNCSLLGILGRHGKLALAGRSVDQREEDDIQIQWPKYTLEDYGFTWERIPRANLL